MKKFAALTLAAFAALGATQASAFFFDNNDKWSEPECWYNPTDCNPYDPWDPRYWMEEMDSMWSDDDDYYGYGPYGMPGMPYGNQMNPYMRQMNPYGYQAPAAPQAQAPAAGNTAPQAAAPAQPQNNMPYMPYNMPRMPYNGNMPFNPYQQYNNMMPQQAPQAPAQPADNAAK